MRFLIKASIPTEAGNNMVKDPNFMANLEKYISTVKAEAAYFYEYDGDRTFLFVVDMPSADMIPVIAEPLFQNYHAKVEFKPTMVLADLKKAIQNLPR